MTKVHKPGSQKQEKKTGQPSRSVQGKRNAAVPHPKIPVVPPSNEKKGKQNALVPPPQAPAVTPSTENKGKQSGKSTRPRVGGTAVPGAKSTQPKEVAASSSPSQQDAESYNREMRRRMQHLGTGPYNESSSPAEKQRKRVERRKKRIEERKQEVHKIAASGPSKITLGRRNTYFLIGAVVLLVLLIVIVIIVRHPFG